MTTIILLDKKSNSTVETIEINSRAYYAKNGKVTVPKWIMTSMKGTRGKRAVMEVHTNKRGTGIVKWGKTVQRLSEFGFHVAYKKKFNLFPVYNRYGECIDNYEFSFHDKDEIIEWRPEYPLEEDLMAQ